MKTKELPIELQNLIIACEGVFYRSDMTASEEDHDEQAEYILNSELDDLGDLFSMYTDMVEGML